jgi:hypothetical protein
MSVIKIDNGQVAIYHDNGNLEGILSVTDVRSAAFSPDESLILVTQNNGYVMLHNRNSYNHEGIVVTNAIDAKWSGDDIAVTHQDGRVVLYAKNGNHIRTL